LDILATFPWRPRKRAPGRHLGHSPHPILARFTAWPLPGIIPPMLPAALVILAYLLGAIPFSLLIGLARGVDIRQQGSRNIGATNLGRVVGRKWGFLGLALDILKGFGPTLAASLLLPGEHANLARQGLLLLVALAAVLGHVFPIYLGLRGGKGVATTIGVALGIWPYFTIAMAAALVLYAVVRFATGAVSAGSLALAVTFPAALFVFTRIAGIPLRSCWPLLAVAILLGLLIIIRHRENIHRLLRGRELRIERDRSGSTIDGS
jgi:glycerol-3-phosphate acyltransferase PlsY